MIATVFFFPYTVSMAVDDEGDVIARIPELSGCVAHGGNVAEALSYLEEVMGLYLEELKSSGQAVPEPSPARPPHATIPVQVWADVDVGIADMVVYLNTIPGVRTLYSCQGTIGEGGPSPYRAQVGVTWPDDQTLERLKGEFDITPQGQNWGDLHPREQDISA